MRIALFGPPGAGKGTQTALLEQMFGLQSVSTGNLIRSAVHDDSPFGRELGAYIEDGGLVPDEIVQKLAEDRLLQYEFINFILDGFPRTVVQAVWLRELLETNKAPIQVVISMAVPDEIIIERLSQRRIHKITCEPYHLTLRPPPADIDPDLIVQRSDDRIEAIKVRLDTYRKMTRPVADFYQKSGLLTEISGDGTSTEIRNQIIKVLESRSVLQVA
jgi:adenylate kinase